MAPGGLRQLGRNTGDMAFRGRTAWRQLRGMTRHRGNGTAARPTPARAAHARRLGNGTGDTRRLRKGTGGTDTEGPRAKRVPGA
ncbi:hypothetical protein STEG23_034911 [Scotinomys teguina]